MRMRISKRSSLTLSADAAKVVESFINPGKLSPSRPLCGRCGGQNLYITVAADSVAKALRVYLLCRDCGIAFDVEVAYEWLT